MRLKILLTGKNRKIIKDLEKRLEMDRHYATVKCEPYKTALFDLTLQELPKVIIICLGDETAETVRAYDVLRDALRRERCTVIVIANAEDEKFFIRFTKLERMFFLSRPVSMSVLYEKLEQIEKELLLRQERNLSEFREYVNEKQGTAHPGKQILVVDDDPEQLIHIKELLEEFYEVTLVKSGKDAFRFLAKKKPDLVLLDYLMPEMDGPEVLRKMRSKEEYKEIPVIFLTGVTEKSKVLQTLTQLRPQGYIIKPAKKSKLVAKIIEILG